MPNIKNNISAQDTRRKLIDAAGEVFAEVGLHAATIKAITTRAGVNGAAINYHFLDKFELYVAVIRHAVANSPCTLPAGMESAPAEERLRAHIAMQIDDIYSDRPRWHSTLVAHELAQPTDALKAVIDDLIKPRIETINTIMHEILGPDATNEELAYAGMSIGGQCFLHSYHQEVIQCIHADLPFVRNRDKVIDHITHFSLTALYGMRDRIRDRKAGADKR